ncbi:hypothetical protein [Streptomyces sp. SID12488]|uniref:hypothetical protein n=1 Tax=Streptomyces sp. SID12488 TaxID=2706040 RepID=UPI0013D9E5D5|nr:hypothetical protein [Streptomyces sp. SID12488]NEA61813.1 hypothetical protein [Streptomyces sp. SID12488]
MAASPYESSEPAATPEGKAGDTAGSDRGHGSAAVRITRNTASAVLIVLTCVLVPVALLTVWVHDIVLDTDRYVATVAPLASHPAMEDAAVGRITRAADVRADGTRAAADIAGWLRSQGLPSRAAEAVKGLGPQLDSAVADTVEKVATRFVRGDRFERIWTEANRAAHAGVVHALTGEGRGAVGVNSGTVTLDVGEAVDQVRQALVEAGLSPAAGIPEVDKQMVLFQSDQLAKIREGARLLDVIGNWLPVLVVATGTAGVLLARWRRRALARTALGAAFACLVVAVVLAVARRYYLDHLPPQVQSAAAAAAVFDTLLRFLRAGLRTAIVLGVVIALGAYLVGPGRLPLAARGASERAADSAARWAYAHQARTGRVGIWAEAHRRWIALAALLTVALLFALWNRPTAPTVLLLVIALLTALALLALLAATGRATVDAERGPRPGPSGP